MKKNRLLILLASAVIIFFAGVLINRNKPTGRNTEGTQAIQERVSIVIDFADLREKSIMTLDYSDAITPFSMLQELAQVGEIELITTQYDFGVFVNSIDGYENTNDLSWILYVNDQAANTAADKIELEPGATVEWKYTEPIY
ncbi:DUF4430 domain-containing protein [Patescibacteria group bacterium]